MYKIAIIGERDSVMGFMAIGFSVHEAPDPETAAKILHSLAQAETYAPLLTAETYAAERAPTARAWPPLSPPWNEPLARTYCLRSKETW